MRESLLRWAEAVTGLLATLLALGGIIYLLFGPTYSFATSEGASGTAGLWQAWQANAGHIPPITIILFGILILVVLGVGIGAVGHSLTQEKRWQHIVLASAIVLVLLTALGILTIGQLIWPGTVAALVALSLSYVRKTAVLTTPKG